MILGAVILAIVVGYGSVGLGLAAGWGVLLSLLAGWLAGMVSVLAIVMVAAGRCFAQRRREAAPKAVKLSAPLAPKTSG